MTPLEMADACRHTIEEQGLRHVALVIPRRPRKYGRRMRLLADDRRSPLGEIATWTDGGTVCYFDALEVLAWLHARGLVCVIPRVKDGGTDDASEPS